MTPGSRRFFSAFYDAVLPLLRTAARPHTLPTIGPRDTFRSPRRLFYSFRTSQRRLFFSSFVSSTTQWSSRSRYVVSHGFAGFFVCTGVPNGMSPTSAAASTVVTESAVTSNGRRTGRSGRSWSFVRIAFRGFHTAQKGRCRSYGRKQPWRNNSSESIPEKSRRPVATEKPVAGKQAAHPEARGILERVSHIHRPTKDEMLAAATGVWQRLSIRTKWSLIRQMRPYNLEDTAAFFSWLFLGHVVWVVVGTTTFLSMAIWLVNSVFAQGMRKVP
jgi:distribution and morphology protein 31